MQQLNREIIERPEERLEATQDWVTLLGQTCYHKPPLVQYFQMGGASWAFTHKKGKAHSLSNYYCCRNAAIAQAPSDPFPMPAICQLEALPQTDAHDWLSFLNDRNYETETYRHFGNWSLRAENFEAYWQNRPSRTRNTVARKSGKLTAAGNVNFIRYDNANALNEAVNAWSIVEQDSWQKGEPHPLFLPTLIGLLLQKKWGAVWVLTLDDKPVAAQIWSTMAGHATVHKLAYRKSHAAFSPGSVLLAHAIKAYCRDERIKKIDFGRGDDAYKVDWAEQREQLYGVIGYNKNTLTGRFFALPIALKRFYKKSENGFTPNR